MDNNATAINILIDIKPIFESGNLWMSTYWIVAGLMSILVGYNGIVYVIEEKQEVDEECINIQKKLIGSKSQRKHPFPFHYHIEAFISEVILSMFGWASLYLLLANISNASDKYDNFNIFLGTVAVICISGYGYKIVEKLGK